MKVFSKFKDKFSWAGVELASAVNTFYYILVDRRTPWYVKVLSFLSLSYAFSPIDLIPDFIPFAGYLDDFLIIPAMFLLAKKLTPREIYNEAVAKADKFKVRSKRLFEFAGAFLALIFWLAVAGLFIFALFKLVKGHKKW